MCSVATQSLSRFSPGRTLSGEHAYTDYHDWTCRFITVTTRKTPLIGPNQVGWAPLIMSTIAGIVVFTLTMLVIRGISSVPFGRFRRAVQGRFRGNYGDTIIASGFRNLTDWTRWWVAISFDVGVVYLLYASRQPESARSATRRTRVSFTVASSSLLCSQSLLRSTASSRCRIC